MYSSIEEKNYNKVIEKCYWPIFKLADNGFPIAIEAPALTLELINNIDVKWIQELSEYIKNGEIEFIGSGYSQLIGPLVPVQVNKYNQEIGLEIYDQLLGVQPKIALVNEMAYSGGIVDHYIDAGYKGLIMEWNNPRSAHPEWENEWRYYPQKAVGGEGKTIPLIWADSIAFQKYQRYTHGEYALDEYVKYIKSHIGKSDHFFPLYSNDVEVIDYRPGRYQTEAKFDNNLEWDRIIELYTYLSQKSWCDFVFPNQVLDSLKDNNCWNELKLETLSQPIPVKKQEKYNINRWALTGRDDVGINSKCYKIYNSYIENENNSPDNWKELCYLWSSDFRTHITKKRWSEYISRLDKFVMKCKPLQKKEKKDHSYNLELANILEEDKSLTVENSKYKIIFNNNKGFTIKEIIVKNLSDLPLLGTLDHGYYDDISLGADYYSGHAIIERLGVHKVTDLGKLSPKIIQEEHYVALKTEQKWNDYTFNTMIQLNDNKISLKKNISSNTDEKAIIRPFNFTINPKAWDRNSLYIKTHNGGTNLDKFYLKDQNIAHSDIYSSLISARHAFGNTEGLFIIGDKVKSITFKCNMSVSALIPSIIYKEMDNTFFFRIRYSARELDETLQSSILVLSSTISLSFQNGSD